MNIDKGTAHFSGQSLYGLVGSADIFVCPGGKQGLSPAAFYYLLVQYLVAFQFFGLFPPGVFLEKVSASLDIF